MSVFYFWKNDKNRKKEGRRNDSKQCLFICISSSPYFSSCFFLLLQCFEAVALGFPLEGKIWLFAFCLSSMNVLAGGLRTEESFGLTLLWSTNAVLDCANEDNLSNDKAPLPYGEVWRKVSIQCGQIIQDRIGKFFRAGEILQSMDFHGRNYHKSKQEVEALQTETVVNIVSITSAKTYCRKFSNCMYSARVSAA